MNTSSTIALDSCTFSRKKAARNDIAALQIQHASGLKGEKGALTVTLSLLFSTAVSFSFGVLAVSVGAGCELEVGCDDLFTDSVLISVSVSCCVAVAKTKIKWKIYKIAAEASASLCLPTKL